ncbi:MAG: redoxin domain-containing (seleno)protein, partial [Blastocatellia bacterium]
MLMCLTTIGDAFAANRVVIFDNIATEVAPPPAALATGHDIWVTLADLT